MKTLLGKIDKYTIKPKLFINGGESIPTKPGAILSIITYLVSLSIIINSLIGVFNRENYMKIFNQEFKKFYTLDLSKKPIFFNFYSGLKNQDVQNFDRIIEISANHQFINPSDTTDNSIKKTILNVESCKISKMPKETSSHFTNEFQIEKFYCLDNLQKNITIQGERGSFIGHSNIDISFSRCVNSTENKNKCLPKETITDYINYSYFIWGSLDYDINHDLFGDPFEPKIFTEFHEINKKLMTQLLIRFKQVKYFSDQGFFSKSLETYTYPLHFNTLSETLDNSRDQNKIISLILNTSGLKEIHFRRYQKVQEALAIVSALVNIMSLICGIIMNSFFGENIYFEYLISALINDTEKGKEAIREKDRKIFIKNQIIKDVSLVEMSDR